MSGLLQQLVNGLSLASVFALVGIGITLIFGLTGIVNFAHGEFLMLGGFLTWWAVTRHGLSYVPAILIAAAAVLLLGFLLERGVWRWCIERPINGFIISLGMSVILANAVVKAFDSTQQPVSIATPYAGQWSLFGGELVLQVQRLVIIGVTAALLVAGFWVVQRTAYGRALRAISEDRATAALMGIPVRRYVSAVFAIGSGLAGIGGALVIGLFPVSPYSGQTYVVTGFAVALVGGLGSISGAVVAALILGVVQALSSGYLYPEWTEAYSFVLMIVILLARPQGLFRGSEGSRV